LRKLILTFIFFLLCLTSLADPINVAELVADENGNPIVYKNIDKVHPLASVTKMMTALIVFEKIENGELSLKDRVSISEGASRIGGSRIYMKQGEYMSVEDLLKSTIVYSANNAAYALAEHVGGSADGFVKIMRKRAKELGMDSTVYNTPTGLPTNMTGKDMDVSTARDIVKLSTEVLKHPAYLKMVNVKKSYIRNGRAEMPNRNKLIGSVQGIDGLKTGHHDSAGYNISISAKRGSKRIIVVVLGAPDEKERDKEVVTLVEKFYRRYEFIEKIKYERKNQFKEEFEIARNDKKRDSA